MHNAMIVGMSHGGDWRCKVIHRVSRNKVQDVHLHARVHGEI